MTETAIYRFAVDIYNLLRERAELNKHEELLFTGKLTEVFRLTGASRTYYSGIRKLLDSPVNDPCIVVRERGAGRKLSVVELRHPPPAEWGRITADDLTRAGEPAKLASMQKDVERFAAFLDGLGGVNLREILLDYERRLSRLEQLSERERE